MGIKSGGVQSEERASTAVMCGIFSAGMSFAMNAAKPMYEAAAALGALTPFYVALPSYVVIMGAARW